MSGRVWLAALGLGILCSVGCGSSSRSSSGTANLRVFQGSPDAQHADVLVDGKQVSTDIAYGGNSGYISVNSGSRHVQVVPTGGSAPIADQTLTLASNSNQTMVITGPVASAKTVVLTDAGTTAAAGDGYMRVFNASNSVGPADVYIVVAGASIVGIQPVVSSMAFDKDTGYKLLPAGNYDIFLTAPATTNAYLNTGSINLPASANQTVVTLDNNAGGLTYALLTD